MTLLWENLTCVFSGSLACCLCWGRAGRHTGRSSCFILFIKIRLLWKVHLAKTNTVLICFTFRVHMPRAITTQNFLNKSRLFSFLLFFLQHFCFGAHLQYISWLTTMLRLLCIKGKKEGYSTVNILMNCKCLTVLFGSKKWALFSFWIPQLENMEEWFSTTLKSAGKGPIEGSSAADFELQCNACISLHFKVPVGTLVKEDGKVVADLTQHGEEYVAAYGGAGGKGNRFFLSNENRAPTLFTPGEPGQERVLHLELKTTAHAGLVSVIVVLQLPYHCRTTLDWLKR